MENEMRENAEAQLDAGLAKQAGQLDAGSAKPADLAIDDFPARELDPERFEGKTFKEIFKSYSERFMDERQIAKALMLGKSDLDRKCMALFGMNSHEACAFYRANADAEVREALWRLALTGNNTATKIYSEYIADLAKDKASDAGGIKVVINVPKEDDDDD